MTLPHSRELTVLEVPVAAAWYAKVFDARVEELSDDCAQISRGDGVPLKLRRGTPNPHPSTPVLEIVVDDLHSWLEPALADGATRMTPIALPDYAQFRDPFGYVWAFSERIAPTSRT